MIGEKDLAYILLILLAMFTIMVGDGMGFRREAVRIYSVSVVVSGFIIITFFY